ncbi:MAG TPA: DUF6611 family protein [Mycobacterium sp.]|nr:DUF6611 family protein [Mycobacterium sp.]
MANTHHEIVEPDAGWLARLLDGDHLWGSPDTKIGHYGIRRYRLVIYPPGTTTADRRLARLQRGWPLGGAALVLLAMMIGDAMSSPYFVPAVAAAAYLCIRVLLFLLAGPDRVHVRSMSCIVMPGATDANEPSGYTEWKALARMLIRADDMLKAGAISPAGHEAIWWHAYDRLGETTHV